MIDYLIEVIVKMTCLLDDYDYAKRKCWGNFGIRYFEEFYTMIGSRKKKKVKQ